MGESAKILNPEKKVVMADDFADCPMAHMVTVEKIREVRESYDDIAVVCYVNSTAEIKAVSDVCVTSSNALRVVEKLPAKNPGKKFYSVGHRQFCPNMKRVTLDKVEQALNTMEPALELSEQMISEAGKPLQRMLELS